MGAGIQYYGNGVLPGLHISSEIKTHFEPNYQPRIKKIQIIPLEDMACIGNIESFKFDL